MKSADAQKEWSPCFGRKTKQEIKNGENSEPKYLACFPD